jgi:hypothetical protein
MMVGGKPIVIAGLPRSGTTWTLRALGTAPGTRKAFEPDNEEQHPAAIHAKARLGRYPLLHPGDSCPPYHRLWSWILSGAHEGARARAALAMLRPGRSERTFDRKPDLLTWTAGMVARDPLPWSVPDRTGGSGRVVAKSVHLQLALGWVADSFDVETLVLLRHPANVLTSWMEMDLRISSSTILETRPDIRAHFVDRWDVPLPGADRIEQLCWRIGLLSAALEESVTRNPGFHVRHHETLCADPLGQFRNLFDELGLEWTTATEDYLADHDSPGEGFSDFRVASELSHAWQKKLDDGQLATLRRVLGWFPVTTWGDRDFERT